MSEKQTPRKRRTPKPEEPPTPRFLDGYPFDEKAITEWLLKDYHPIQNPMYHGSANWAKQVLGFDVYSQIPVDEKAFGDFIKARGFRKGKDIEWYAAAILRQHALILRHYVGKAISRLGRLEKEFDRLILKALKHQDIDKGPRKGGGVRGTRIKEKKAPGHTEISEAAAKTKPGLPGRVKAALLKEKK